MATGSGMALRNGTTSPTPAMIYCVTQFAMKTEEERLEEIRLAVENGVTAREFWHSRTPQERIWAGVLMNRRKYGYDENSMARIERVLEVVTLKRYGNNSESSLQES